MLIAIKQLQDSDWYRKERVCNPLVGLQCNYNKFIHNFNNGVLINWVSQYTTANNTTTISLPLTFSSFRGSVNMQPFYSSDDNADERLSYGGILISGNAPLSTIVVRFNYRFYVQFIAIGS